MLMLSNANAEIAEKGKLWVEVGRRRRRRRRRPILISRAAQPQAAGSQKRNVLKTDFTHVESSQTQLSRWHD